MGKYNRLTKYVIDKDGNRCAACVLHGTDGCRSIHKGESCHNCPVLAAMITRLYAFEDAYLEGESYENY